MIFITPRNFKNSKYYFGKYDKFDLLLIVPSSFLALISFITLVTITQNPIHLMIGITVCLAVVFTVFILTINLPIYHNILGRLKARKNFKTKQKVYVWYGVQYEDK